MLKMATYWLQPQEERFTRIKHDSNFPKNAIMFVLAEAKIKLNQVEK